MMMNERVVIGDGEVGGDRRGAALVDERALVLHRRLKRMAKARGHLDAKELEALREAQRLALWRGFGYTSLADYMTNELGYNYRAAEDRLRVANLLPELPKLTEALQTGNLNFSQARELARVVTPETEEKWIEKAKDLSVREVEQAVAGHTKGSLPEDAPDPKLIRKTLWLSVRPETDVLYREARAQLQKDRGEKLDDDAVLEALCRAFLATHAAAMSASSLGMTASGMTASGMTASGMTASGMTASGMTASGADQSAGDGDATDHANRAHSGAEEFPARGTKPTAEHALEQTTEPPASAGRAHAASTEAGAARSAYRIAVTVCGDCKRGWRHGAGAVEVMSPPAVDVALCDAQFIGDVGSDRVERAHEAISPATRRKVLHRDQNRCRVPGCQAHTNLDIHHVFHREHGGTNELGNLLTLCEAHHLAHHDGTLAIVRAANGEMEFRREGRNNFTRAMREVETSEELRRRGLGRDAIKKVMTQVVTHVGVNSISAEHWIAIALRYAQQLGVTS